MVLNCSWNSDMTWHSAATSSLLTFSTLTSGGFSRSACGFTLLRRFDDWLAEFVSFLGGEAVAEGIKIWFDSVSPIGVVGDWICGRVVGSNCDTIASRFSCVELEGFDGCSVDVIGDSMDVLEFISAHSVLNRRFTDFKFCGIACQFFCFENW